MLCVVAVAIFYLPSFFKYDRSAESAFSGVEYEERERCLAWWRLVYHTGHGHQYL